MADKRKQTGENWRPATRAVRGGIARTEFGETNEAMFLTSGYVYKDAATAAARFKGEDDGYIYSRFGNPTVRIFEERLAAIEEAEDCRATATGMAAVFAALMCQLKAGDHVVSGRAIFGSINYIMTDLLPRFGVETTLVDGRDLDQWQAAMRPNTRCVFLESPSNPTLEIVDIAAVAEIGHSVGARVIIDNVFSTPVLQQPMKLGADIVVYSTTKHIDGQGRCLGGAILGSAEWVKDELVPFYRNTGPSMSPFNAWVMLKGLETLELRVDKMCDNATRVAEALSTMSGLVRVLYPGLKSHPQHALAMRQMSAGGSVVTFEINDGQTGAFRFLDALQIVDISNNLGDAKSLITHPATTTHQRLSIEDRADLGITDGTVRLSVGLEDAADIIDDLKSALAAV
jgi:O-succinylhomoserine sulfhydrylase